MSHVLRRQNIAGLGEVWINGDDSEVTYTGETGDSVFSMQYYRNKIREFQTTLNALDTARDTLEAAIYGLEDVDFDAAYDLQEMLNELMNKRQQFVITAEALNLAASGVNALGGRLPELSIPTGLAAPIVIPVALVAAVGSAAALIYWGNTWLQGVSSRMKMVAAANLIADPVKRDAFVARIGEIDAAAAASNGSSLSQIANIVKWGALALGAFMAFKAFESHNSQG